MCGFRHTGRPLSCGNCIAVYRKAYKLWFDDPQDSDPLRVIEQRKDALRSRELQFQVGAMDDHKNLPTLIGKLKFDWPNFPVDDILRQFTTLKDGILRGVFKQQAACAWYCCRTEKALVLLPGKCCYSTWTDLVDCMPHSCSKSFNIGRMLTKSVSATSRSLVKQSLTCIVPSWLGYPFQGWCTSWTWYCLRCIRTNKSGTAMTFAN